jgi:hypothetical protein
MKTLFNRIALALLIASLAGVTALAKAKKETVSFPTNIKVNGTLVNSGTYELKFDDKTGELLVMKSGKVVAKAMTSATKRDRKASALEIRSTGSGNETELISVAFSGADQNLVLNGSSASR